MASRIGWSAAGVSFATGAVLALFEVQGWKMWPWLAVTLLIVLIAAGAIFGIVLLLSLWEAVRGWRLNYGLRWPVFRTDVPDPNQWLLGLAKDHAQNPEARLIILKAEITNKDLRPEQYRPWLEIGLTMRNTNICSIVVGQAEGYVVYKGNELPTPVESSQHSNKPPNHEHVYKLKIYVPQEITEAIMEDIVAGRHRVASFGFTKVRIEVVSEGEYGCKTWLSLGNLSYVDVPN